MINHVASEQLKKCKVADIPIFDDNTLEMTIPQKTIGGYPMLPNHSYVIQLSMNVLDENQYGWYFRQFDCGLMPRNKFILASPVDFTKDSVKIDGVGCNASGTSRSTDVYVGYWLPISHIRILRKIEDNG